MFSVVLATMLTTAGGAPNWGWHSGCRGCSGCHGCGGCHGCWGSCYGGGGCHGCRGGCYGGAGCYGGGGHGCWSSYGCSGSGGCYGCGGGGVFGPAKTTPPAEKKDSQKSALEAGPATVVIQLPADTKLFIDGQLDPQRSDKRTIVTPNLAADREYYYQLKAEVTQGGKVVRETKRVALRAGHLVEVDFRELNPAATASR